MRRLVAPACCSLAVRTGASWPAGGKQPHTHPRLLCPPLHSLPCGDGRPGLHAVRHRAVLGRRQRRGAARKLHSVPERDDDGRIRRDFLCILQGCEPAATGGGGGMRGVADIANGASPPLMRAILPSILTSLCSRRRGSCDVCSRMPCIATSGRNVACIFCKRATESTILTAPQPCHAIAP